MPHMPHNLYHTAHHCSTWHNAMAHHTMLWHQKQCHCMKHNAMAQKTVLQQITQCRGTSHNAMPQKTAMAPITMQWHKKTVHSTMPWHISTKNSTWRNAMAHCATPWHKAQMPWHQSHCCGTKHDTVAQKQPSGTKNSAAGRTPQHNAIPPTQQSKSLRKNITTTKAKMTMMP